MAGETGPASRLHQGIRPAVKVAAPRFTAPIPTRLAPTPKVSAIHPNIVIPNIAQAMTPELNTPNTRAMRCLGVRSCNDADMMGVTNPELAPIMTIKPAAMIMDALEGSSNTAAPPASAAATNVQSLRQRPSCFFHNSQSVVSRIPMLREDQSHPSETESTCKSF